MGITGNQLKLKGSPYSCEATESIGFVFVFWGDCTYQVFCNNLYSVFTYQVFWILYSQIRYSAPSRGANRHIDLTDRLYIGGIQVATCSNIDPDEDTFKWSIFFEIWPMWPNISVEKEKSRNPTRSEERQFGSTGLSQGLQQQKIQKIQNTGLSKGFQTIKYYKIQNTELSQGFQQKGYSILGCLKVHKEFCQPNANLSKVLSKKYLAFILIFALFMCRLVWDLSKTFSSSCFENLHLLWMESGNCMQNNTLIETFPRNWFTFWWIITNYRKLFRKIKLQ